MNSSVGSAWIAFFYTGANFIAFCAALTGVVCSLIFAGKVKEFLGRETRQHVRGSTLVAYFLVASVGMSFASFTEEANESFYYGTGANFSSAGNPITWRAEDAPSLNAIQPELLLTAVILIGFTFLGSVAFYLAFLTMFRFDGLHPNHHGAVKDFFMYMFGGVACTNIEMVMRALSKLVPILSSSADLLEKAGSFI